ncbi:MAG TPA: condensation domain-containing protein, partial [Steroidobacteraceae bacterium]
MDAVSGAPVEDIYPLTPLQQGLLFHSLYEPLSTVYVTTLTCRLAGPLDVDAFQAAWASVVDRHAVLRTAFLGHELQTSLQVVLRRAALPVRHHDWRDMDATVQATQFAELVASDRAERFDFARPPLMRLNLIRVGDAEHRLIWSSHHVLFDGWSIPILIDEVFAAYGALCRREPPQLAPARPYREYIAWLPRQDMAAAEDYWRRRLAAFATPTSAGLARTAGTSAAADRYVVHDHELPVALPDIAAFARRHRLTVNTLVQGAWALLLARYGGSDDVVFGVTVAGRPAELEVERTVGLFINTLPLRIAVTPAQPVVHWLRDLPARQTELLEHQYAPLSEVQRWSEVPAGTPLFDSIVVFENYPAELSTQVPGHALRMDMIHAINRINYPLALQVATGQSLSLKLMYDAGRFEPAAITRIAEHLRTLLDEIVSDPDRAVADVPLLSEAERRMLVSGFNATATDYPHQRCLHELVAEQAARTPDAPALMFQDHTLSYGALERRANQLAHYLRARGVGPDVVVGVCAERSIEMVVALLGILKAGGAYLPLDPSYPPDRLAYMLEDAKAPVLLTQAALADRLPPTGAATVRLDADWPHIARGPTTTPDSTVAPDNLAYVIYTSGST